MTRVGAVDLGTNSTRLLVADVEDGRVRELERCTEVTRLGDGVDASGRLSPEAMERVYEVLARYREIIDGCEADRLDAVATSAVRDAANSDDFRAALHERFGIDARTLTGEEEATLTFLGATSAHGERRVPTLVVDVGGGSTEFVTGTAGAEPSFHASTRAGSVRQTERHLRSDPPGKEELRALRREVRAIIDGSIPARVRARVEAAIAVAGTPTSLAAVDQQLEPYDPAKVEGYELELPACERMLAELAGIPLPERCQVRGLHPARAPTIVAGSAILIEAMLAFGLDRIQVSEADLLHGVALRPHDETV